MHIQSRYPAAERTAEELQIHVRFIERVSVHPPFFVVARTSLLPIYPVVDGRRMVVAISVAASPPSYDILGRC